MCDIDFIIPLNRESLLESYSGSYYVRNLCIISSINEQLQNAHSAFQYDGPAYILDNFDIYYSILHHINKINADVIIKSINDLLDSCKQLHSYLQVILEESEMQTDLQLKTLNVTKMLIYLLIETVIQFENEIQLKKKQRLNIAAKGRRRPLKSNDDEEIISNEEKLEILNLLLNIIKLPIHKLWDPPVCEEQFINLIAEFCYALLQNPLIKSEKEICNVVFKIFGVLLKNYNYALTFSVRLTQIVKLKDNEHLVAVIPLGIKTLVVEYHCKSLVRELVREFTEWQSDESCLDTQGTKHCSNILIEVTGLMPKLMLEEIIYLQKYLHFNSYTLRNCVLSISSEVILKVLAEEHMDDQLKEVRNDLLTSLSLHILDVNAHVRSRVLQCLAKLQTDTAIPLGMLPELIEKVARRLNDKAALVRKNAVHLLTTFIKHNPFSSKLDGTYFKTELEKETEKLKELQSKSTSFTVTNITKKEDEWNNMKKDLKEAIEEVLEDPKHVEIELNSNTSFTSSSEMIRMYLANGQYKDAVQIGRLAEKSSKYAGVLQKAKESGEQVSLFLQFFHSVYVDFFKSADSLCNITAGQLESLQDHLKNVEQSEQTVKYITDVVGFINIIYGAASSVKELLHSATLTDVTGAIEFFVAANQFEIEFAAEGLTEMLYIMNSTDKDRVNAVIEAYKTVFLTVKNSSDRAMIIVRRLIKLLHSVTRTTEKYLSLIVSRWVSSGDLDNSVIEILWGMFTGRVQSDSTDDSLAALRLLRMAAGGRKSIIDRNVNLIAEFVFGDKGYTDLRLVIVACQMIGLLGGFTVDVTSATPNFRLPYEDTMWNKIHDLLVKCFTKKNVYYSATVTAVIDLIFKLCSKPDKLCTRIIYSVASLFMSSTSDIVADDDTMDPEYLAQLIHLLGAVAANYFIYLDVTVYKELKRRTYAHEEEKKSRKRQGANVNTSILSVDVSSASARLKKSNRTEDLDDSYMDGASGDDADAEFILRVCDSEIVTGNLLGDFVPMLVHILRRPHKFEDANLQASATLTLMRFMTVTSKICEEHLTLIMALLEMTKYPQVKNNILVLLADLVHRFPNTIEPWSCKLYERLKDKEESVRITAVSVITGLLMEDMLRVKGTVADLAQCIVDPCPTIVDITKHFFNVLAKKGNTIYNILPDIISRLTNDNNPVDEDVFREVIRFLIVLIDKDRQMEPLVEKLCLRLQLTEKPRQWRDIAYCLTLLNHNEKSLERLIINYKIYKNCLEQDDVRREFISLVQKYKNNAKDEIKSMARKLDQLLSNGEIIAGESAANESKRKSQAKRSKRLKS